DREGDVARGKLIYYSDGARCRACHDIDDRSKSFGPTIMEINKRFIRSQEMLQHVINPSMKIDDQFAAYSILTNDGRNLSGLVVKKNDKEVVLRTLEKVEVRIPRDQIDEMRKSEKSLMPDRILSDLTAQEAADLVAYIRSLGAAK